MKVVISPRSKVLCIDCNVVMTGTGLERKGEGLLRSRMSRKAPEALSAYFTYLFIRSFVKRTNFVYDLFYFIVI